MDQKFGQRNKDEITQMVVNCKIRAFQRHGAD